MNENQSRLAIDAAQLHAAYMDAYGKSRAYRVGMHWKKAKDREYLFRSLDRYGYGKSLGPRSATTESICTEFHNNKKEVLDRLEYLKKRLKEQAPFNKAPKIDRVNRCVLTVSALLPIFFRHIHGQGQRAIGTTE